MTEDKSISSAARPPAITRNMVVWLLSTPDRTDGSLNDPREREEHGIRFNEKWTYGNLTDDPADAATRIIYWDRYDFKGTVIRAATEDRWQVDTALEAALRSAAAGPHATDRRSPEELELTLQRRDRRLYQVGSRNPVLTPSNEHRPVSDFRGPPDLGGRLQK